MFEVFGIAAEAAEEAMPPRLGEHLGREGVGV